MAFKSLHSLSTYLTDLTCLACKVFPGHFSLVPSMFIDEIQCQKTVDLRFVLDACRGTLKYVVPKQDGSQEMWEVESSIGLKVYWRSDKGRQG